jgi:hypothetical protein
VSRCGCDCDCGLVDCLPLLSVACGSPASRYCFCEALVCILGDFLHGKSSVRLLQRGDGIADLFLDFGFLAFLLLVGLAEGGQIDFSLVERDLVE